MVRKFRLLGNLKVTMKFPSEALFLDFPYNQDFTFPVL